MRVLTEVQLKIAAGIATITLDRPSKLNAFTPRMARDLVAAFDETDSDDSVRVVVLTGAGRAFCAGADMSTGAKAFDSDDAERGAQREGLGTVGGVNRDLGGYVTLRIAASTKPVIVAFNGPAVGVGATMALPADIRIAADTARIGFVFARRGLVPEAASSWFLSRVVGISQAMEWVATGRVFDADEALRGGLVSRAVSGAELLAVARSIADEIIANTSPASVALTRRMMWSMLSESNPWEAHRLDSRAIFELGKRQDPKEGVRSFLEKRPPVFTDSVTGALDLVPEWPARPSGM